ncbi:LuxR family transcriptional regulator [Antrihabitans sp. YC2-6]|nr:LuxR family transcriptional regulator [Antrihabitans sp. YC2-6]
MREVLRLVETTSDGALRVLVRGPSASGKSILLNEIRERVQLQGTSTTTQLRDVPPGVTVVVDDAHALSDSELDALYDLVDRAQNPVIVATEPRPHRGKLRPLTAALGRSGRVFDLRHLGQSDVAALARQSGVSLTAESFANLVTLTGGLHGAVVAALGGVRSSDAAHHESAAKEALLSWVRSTLKTQDSQLLSTLALTATGSGLDPIEVSEIVGVDEAAAVELIDRVRACGLVADPDVLTPIATEPLRSVLGDRRFVDIQQRLLDVRLEAGALRSVTAMRLAKAGVRDPRLAEFLTSAADHAEPRSASKLYAAAIAAGADPADLALRRCEAAALSGDTTTAHTIAEGVLANPDATPAELATAVRVRGGILAERGTLGRAADLYAWLGRDRIGADAGLAAATLFAVGRPDEARAVRTAQHSGPPTDLSIGIAALGSALELSVDGPAHAAISVLVRSNPAGGPAATVMPVDPAAVAVQLCLHSGDLDRAQAVLGRIDVTSGPNRHLYQLLSAWTSMLTGDDDGARGTVDALDATQLGNRDLLLAHAIRVGLARRSGDHGALVNAWTSAHRVLDEADVDLFTLLPLGELWLAAIRVDDVRRVAHLVTEASDLLTRLGDPPAWANTFHWYGVQAALLADNPADLVPHAQALRLAAEGPVDDPYATALAAAGRAWLRVLRGEADPAEVERSAKTLGSIGLPWDGARLASEGALRAADTQGATALLQVARSLRQNSRRPDRSAPAPATPANGPLSDREGEVADLLVLGLTYREVGSRLYISAKTVEHHVARIRRRIGAGSRSELLSMLRAMGHGEVDRTQP